MRLGLIAAIVSVGVSTAPAFAEDPVFEPLPPLDLDGVDPDLTRDLFGRWTIASEDGEKTCRVELLREQGIGGMQIDIDPACESVFPIMGEIAAWRLLEGWAIDFVDIERRTRIRFSTPDERYVAFPETDHIFTIEPDPVE